LRDRAGGDERAFGREATATRDFEIRRGGRSATFSDRDLTRGLRAVADRYHHSPSLREYDLIAPGLYLASGQTVCTRFGGWRRALAAAGLDSAPPARTYASRWHLAACWRALESVADELGDPPRFVRYAELAARREDLPSPPTVRARLGPWSQIAAELMEQKAARGARARAEQVGEGRVATHVELAALRHLAGHPGSSGTEVRRGAQIRSASQTWTLLARLEREGLLVNESRALAERTYRNAWRLSARGEAVLAGLPAGMYAEASA
jgi:hypothetical protein